jgi:hypothetical protein
MACPSRAVFLSKFVNRVEAESIGGLLILFGVIPHSKVREPRVVIADERDVLHLTLPNCEVEHPIHNIIGVCFFGRPTHTNLAVVAGLTHHLNRVKLLGEPTNLVKVNGRGLINLLVERENNLVCLAFVDTSPGDNITTH